MLALSVPVLNAQQAEEQPEEPLSAQRCTPTSTALVFDGGYRVSMCYATPDGTVAQARSGIWSSGEAGLLYFFNPGNAEVLVKVLDACSVPASRGGTGHRWVFVAPVTTLAFNLRITAPGGQVWTHSNVQGRTASARSDLYAFDCSGSGPPPPPSVPPGFDLANADPRGITYAGGLFFVVDWLDESIYAYNARSGRRESAYDFDLAPENAFPEGITHLSGRLYVVDWFDEKVYVYDAATGSHEPAYDFDLAPQNVYPEGISFADADGTGVLLVADNVDQKAYAYDLDRRPSADFNFDAINDDPTGIAQFNGVIYVVDRRDSYVYTYRPYGTASNRNESNEPLVRVSAGSELGVAYP